MSPTDAEIGARMVDVRKQCGMNQHRASAVLTDNGFHCTQQMLKRIENGSRPLRATEAVVVAASFGVPLDWLLTASEDHESKVSLAYTEAMTKLRQIEAVLRE